MGKETFIIELARKIRPAIIKIVPLKYLKKLKQNIVQKKLNKIINSGIQPYNEKYPDGINLIASIQGDFGLGQSSRLIADVLDHINWKYCIYNFVTPQSANYSNHSYDHKITNKLMYGINLIHINPLEMEWLYLKIPKENWDNRYNIAFWLWELEEFPEEWTRYFPFLDEIWTPSEFVSKSIRKKTNLPVKTVPYYVTAKTNSKYNRKYFKLPEKIFFFLTMYDLNSVKERKNPEGVVKAFKKAFDYSNNNVGLIIKINGGTLEEKERMKQELKLYENIYFFTENMEKTEVNGLIKCADVFVSLHRAEGFGLVMAEAMYLGTPVIATNWSSNIEFMNQEVACMVEAKLIRLSESYGPFKKGNIWADPNLEQAASYMKKLYMDNRFYERIKNNAVDFIHIKLSLEESKKLINSNLNQIIRGKRK